MNVGEIIGSVMIAAGSLFLLTGALGLLRLPEFFSRTHAASLTDTAAAGLILLGLLGFTDTFATGIRLILILVFLLFASPTASHALAQAAVRDGLRPMTSDAHRRPGH